MILEDQTLIALSLEAYLEEIGLGACESFASSAEALEWLGSHTPSVAILDFSLRMDHAQRWPVLSGSGACLS
jgi:DNA-binding NtrC family response regulator